MFEDRSPPRTFYSAPQSVTSLLAAFMEPAITIASFVAAALLTDQPLGRSDTVLCLLVFALTFPGVNRFGQRPLNAAVDIAWSWLGLLLILLMCGYATRSLDLFAPSLLLAWALATPVLTWLAVFCGRNLLRRWARLPQNRHSAVIIGAGALGAKLARSLVSPVDRGVDVLGFFDDRTGDRVHEDAAQRRLGSLSEAAPWMRSHGVHQVYITLPLGSQPRIVGAAGRAAGHHRQRLLRARRVRHQHHPGPAAGHPRHAGGGPVRDPLHRHQPLVKRCPTWCCRR
jgi:putative colanic acid biosynthesis UDP-glucose lipid carrier transferase